jgi:hypothetical protein
MKVLHTTVVVTKMDSSLIGLLKIVANMQECGSLESITEVSNLGISCDEACKPIVGDTD